MEKEEEYTVVCVWPGAFYDLGIRMSHFLITALLAKEPKKVCHEWPNIKADTRNHPFLHITEDLHDHLSLLKDHISHEQKFIVEMNKEAISYFDDDSQEIALRKEQQKLRNKHYKGKMNSPKK